VPLKNEKFKIAIEKFCTKNNEIGKVNLTVNKYNFNKNYFLEYFNKLRNNSTYNLNILNKIENKFYKNLKLKLIHLQLKIDYNVDYKDINIYEKENISSFISFTSTKPLNLDENSIKLIKENVTVGNIRKNQYIRYDTHLTINTDNNFNTPLLYEEGLNEQQYDNFSYFNDLDYRNKILNEDFFYKIKTNIYDNYFEKCIKIHSNNIMKHYEDCVHYANIYANSYTNFYIVDVDPVVNILMTLK